MENGNRDYNSRGRPVESADLDDRTFARVVARRARTLRRKALDLFGDDARFGPLRELTEAASAATRETAEPPGRTYRASDQDDIARYFEKVHRDADFLPARFLEDGASKVPAVCRMAVVTPRNERYTATGFLVARGFIMTNNHVLETAEWAERSRAIFDFQEGGDSIRVDLAPERFFLTDEDLDFSIVACDETPIATIEPIPLFQNPALITRGEHVYIIQHPQGRPKEVVLRNNAVIRILDRVVRYRADTEGGSSGSPVFNEDWELVALHHAGWRDRRADGTATNEGVSIAAIIRHLQRLNTEEAAGARGIERVLHNVRDASPFLGFFDAHRSFEVSVDSFSGSSDYADIGFWNIEHFNDRVGPGRIDSVADVVARLSLDAFGLTEVESGALDRLVERLERSGNSYGYAYHNTPGRLDIAILFDRDTTQVVKLDEIYERHQARLKARTPGGKTAFPREPLFCKCVVQDTAEDTPVVFVMIVLHLKAFVTDPPSRSRRALAARMLAEIVDDIRETLDLPVVIGGDYNELITTDVLAPLTAGPDFFALTTDDAADGAISYIGGRHRSLIDHIIVSDDVPLGRIQGDDAAIVRLDRSVADFVSDASDHVPIVMRMVYGDEPVDGAGGSAAALSVEIPEGARKASLSFT